MVKAPKSNYIRKADDAADRRAETRGLYRQAAGYFTALGHDAAEVHKLSRLAVSFARRRGGALVPDTLDKIAAGAVL